MLEVEAFWTWNRMLMHDPGLMLPADEKSEFDLLLITTFTDQKQYDKREDHFAELIQKAGSLKLLNDKKPTEFRESWMSLENLGRLE
jgi:hypothetical protein